MKRTVPLSFIIILFIAAVLYSGTALFAQNIDFGKSYINVSKGVNGGTVETGDTLEIRASLVVRSGTYDSCRFRDNIPAGTAFIPGTIRVLTNEGKIYKQFTNVAGDDPGWISGTTVTIHLGFNPGAAPATAFRRGRVVNTHKPSFYGSTCIMVASYRVVVTSPLNTNINTGGGTITHRRSGTASVATHTFPSNLVRVYTNYGICANTIGVNAIGTEFNGTFGSGPTRNRGVSANVPVGYTYAPFDANMPNDYYYGIANNTSTRLGYSTTNSWAIPDASSPSHRVFSVWDIIGDHTGAVSPTLGNPPADTVANNNAGYMLVINAAYRIDSAFQQTISGLCPNTYYEISCWMRNICSKCGCDSNGKGATNSSGPVYYIPTGTGDSSGVKPNLTFEVNGIDYYSTGNLEYNGQWIKKGFTYLTGPTQTSFILKFFNNAPGGGGNDWALDDISVSTCSPNMAYSPSASPIVCMDNPVALSDTIRSFFNNYTYYKWQRSTDGGLTWTDVTGPLGPATPVWNGTAWEYITYYTVLPPMTSLANSGDMYQAVVATTLANLANVNCRFTDNGNTITLDIIDCTPIMETQLISFTGTISNKKAVLNWASTKETGGQINFIVERSSDGLSFIPIGTVAGFNDPEKENNAYTFTDIEEITGTKYYRIKITSSSGSIKYSQVILLSSVYAGLSLHAVMNPFQSELLFNISSHESMSIITELMDINGNRVKEKSFYIRNGINRLLFDNVSTLPTGVYILRIATNNNTLQRLVIKN